MVDDSGLRYRIDRQLGCGGMGEVLPGGRLRRGPGVVRGGRRRVDGQPGQTALSTRWRST